MMEDIVGGYLSNDGRRMGWRCSMKDNKYAFRSGRGKGDDSHATDLTKVLGFSWIGIEGLKVAGSMTMNNMPVFLDSNSDGEGDWELMGESVGLSLTEFNVQYNNHNFVAVLETGNGEFDVDGWNTMYAGSTINQDCDGGDFGDKLLSLSLSPLPSPLSPLPSPLSPLPSPLSPLPSPLSPLPSPLSPLSPLLSLSLSLSLSLLPPAIYILFCYHPFLFLFLRVLMLMQKVMMAILLDHWLSEMATSRLLVSLMKYK